ncbi:MAG: phosphoribosylanthranilate isomerase [Prevotella sp.]|nr:phosphoribosylanthranilate isomerase [Prevotella sp.]
MENFEKRKSKNIIKVCGMRDGENIQLVSELGVDWIGMVFSEQSPRNVTMIPTHAGIIPDRGPEDLTHQGPRRVGVFTDEMAQNIITRVVNFRLGAIQLNGQEPPTLIRNLRTTLTTAPDGSGAIAPDLQIWKGIRIETAEDLKRCADYEDCVDMFVFNVNDFESIASYNGTLPFLLGGAIGPDDAEAIRVFRHPRFVGIDLDEPFESAPAEKDIERLRSFMEQLRKVRPI